MEKIKSGSFELNTTDYKNILRQIVIIYTPVILLFLNQIKDWNFDINIIYALIISTTVDVVRRYITDYTKT